MCPKYVVTYVSGRTSGPFRDRGDHSSSDQVFTHRRPAVPGLVREGRVVIDEADEPDLENSRSLSKFESLAGLQAAGSNAGEG